MENKLAFCMVTTFYPPFHFGGDAMHIYRLSQELAKRGHQIDVVHCVDAFRLLQPKGQNGSFPNHPNIKVHRLVSGYGKLAPLAVHQTGYPFFKNKLRKLLESKKFDVIHYHNMSLIGLKALAWGKGIKFYTAHEHWLVCPMHVLWKYNRELCRKKDCIRCSFSYKKPVQWWRYTAWPAKMWSHIDHFFSPSNFSAQKHKEFGFPVPMDTLPYFLTGASANKSQEKAGVKENGSSPFFLFVGRLEKIKGLQNVIPLFVQNPDLQLRIAGDGEYRQELEILSKGAKNIKFLGRLDQMDLTVLYQQAQALIVPSLCFETFGIIIIEAFAQRTPVIVRHLGPMPEIVTLSSGGFTFRNEEEFLDRLRKFVQNPELRFELGENGYQAFLKHWNEEAHLKQYFSWIEKHQRQKTLVTEE